MMLGNFSSQGKERKRKNSWKIFLVLIIFLLTSISIYFLFRHFKHEALPKSNTQKSTTNTKKSIKDSPLSSNNNQKPNKYQPIQATQKEPEYQDKLLPISSAGTEYKKSVVEVNMLPRGSAILTGSGDLEKQGIKAIIHACPGSIKKKDEHFRATIQGIIWSVQNAILLAEKNNYKNIAFCLIGSSFLDSIISPNQGTKKERQIKLAEIIIKSAIEQRKNLEKIVFVDFGNSAFITTFSRIGAGEKYFSQKMRGMEAISGDASIANYSSHKCEVIVNALNIEGEFINSGSFSGFIASKTGSGKDKIQKEIKENITEFNKRLKNQSI